MSTENAGVKGRVHDVFSHVTFEAQARVGELAAMTVTAFTALSLLIAETDVLRDSPAIVRAASLAFFLIELGGGAAETVLFHKLGNAAERQDRTDTLQSRRLPLRVSESTPLPSEPKPTSESVVQPVFPELTTDPEVIEKKREEIRDAVFKRAKVFDHPEEDSVYIQDGLSILYTSSGRSLESVLADESDVSEHIAQALTNHPGEEADLVLHYMVDRYREGVKVAETTALSELDLADKGQLQHVDQQGVYPTLLYTLIRLSAKRGDSQTEAEAVDAFHTYIARGHTLSRRLMTNPTPTDAHGNELSRRIEENIELLCFAVLDSHPEVAFGVAMDERLDDWEITSSNGLPILAQKGRFLGLDMAIADYVQDEPDPTVKEIRQHSINERLATLSSEDEEHRLRVVLDRLDQIAERELHLMVRGQLVDFPQFFNPEQLIADLRGRQSEEGFIPVTQKYLARAFAKPLLDHIAQGAIVDHLALVDQSIGREESNLFDTSGDIDPDTNTIRLQTVSRKVQTQSYIAPHQEKHSYTRVENPDKTVLYTRVDTFQDFPEDIPLLPVLSKDVVFEEMTPPDSFQFTMKVDEEGQILDVSYTHDQETAIFAFVDGKLEQIFEESHVFGSDQIQ